MKRFFVSLAVSITFITIGFTSILFEFHAYEIVEQEDETILDKRSISVSDILHNDKIEIQLEDSYLYVDIQEDLEDSDEIILKYPNHADLELKNNKIKIEGYGYTNHNHSYRRIRDIFDHFIEGLKEKKIYVNFSDGYSNRIILHCSPELRSKIKVTYD